MSDTFLGIDGGGTKTGYLLEVNGQKYEFKGKTLHLKQISKDEFKKRLNFAIKEITNMAKIDAKDIDYTFMAMPGFGQFPEDEQFIFESLEEILKSDNFKVDNDCVNGWAGSLNAQAGINLVLGTGSIGFGVDDSGQMLRCGGWGPDIGDEASGYYIGKKLINIFTRVSDGRMDHSLIYDYLKDELEIDEDFEIINKTMQMSRDELASLSKILSKALEKNDDAAINLIDDVAKEAAIVINTLIDKLDFKQRVTVSYSGGVFNLGEQLISRIKKNLSENVDIKPPFADPSTGSLILAKKYYNEIEID